MPKALCEGRDGSTVTLWEGTHLECLAYQTGAHANSVNLYVYIVGDKCACGDLREPITQPADRVFLERTGCLRCTHWDSLPRHRSEVPYA